MIAYILINTEVGDEEKVYEVLLNMKGVLEAHIVYGVYDIIAKVQSESMDGLREVVSEIRKKAGLKSTLTLIVTR
ncbi:Lrp/AsnC family transcriptional regulator [Archaeoglobales archaeon]|nr:MAG: Lrp/AsnC family transcriptional regulator [Archaeoglobales archaeon]